MPSANIGERLSSWTGVDDDTLPLFNFAYFHIFWQGKAADRKADNCLFSANKNEKKLVSTARVLVYTTWYIHIINGSCWKNKQNLKGHTFF